MNFEEKRIWLDYIRSKIDRFRNDDKNTGLTTWALWTALVIIIYKLAADLPALLSDVDSRKWLTYFISVVLNSIWAILLVISGIYAGVRTGYRQRLLPQTSEYSWNVLLALICLSAAIVAFANYLSSRNTTQFHRWPFIIFVVYFLLVFAYHAFRLIQRLYYSAGLETRVHDFSYLFAERKSPAKLLVYSIAFSLVLLATLIFQIANTQFDITLGKIGMLITTSLEVIGFFILLAYLLLRDISASNLGVYEEIEQKLVWEDIGPDDIKQYLEENVMGPTVEQWIHQTKQKVATKQKELSNAAARSARDLRRFVNYLKFEIKELNRWYELDPAQKEELKQLSTDLSKLDEI